MTARTNGPTWAGFVLWVLVGAAIVIGFFTLSVLFLVPIVIGVIVLAVRPTLMRSGFGLVAGMGLVSMYVAYVQRRGPGTVCWQKADSSGCEDFLNPWPWLVVGVILVCVAIVGHLRMTRRAREETPANALPNRSD